MNKKIIVLYIGIAIFCIIGSTIMLVINFETGLALQYTNGFLVSTLFALISIGSSSFVIAMIIKFGKKKNSGVLQN